MGRERRRRIRRTGEAPHTASAAPGTAGDAASGAPSLGGTRPARAAASTTGHVRSDRVMARESAQMMSESKRVLAISAVCFGMLAVLVVVDRLT
jgi:hypothetical protein